VIINAAGRRVDELTGEGREGCAFGPCRDSRDRGGAGCYLCDTIAHLEQPAARQAAAAEVREAEKTNAARDGDPKLAGEKKRGNLAFEKRRRVGPHR
jgi:hypothetical protein